LVVGVFTMQVAIVRLVVLLILLLNQALVLVGWNPLPFSEEQLYEIVSILATLVASLWAWWKNNNVTKKARENEKFLKQNGMK